MVEIVVLIPLDGSGTAEAALPWAVTFCQALRARAVLVRCISQHDLRQGEAPEAAALAALHYLQGVADVLQPQGVTVELRALPAGAEAAAGIIHLAEALDAALIVLASHGRSGLERAMLGSVADAVIRTATRPVLVIHPGATAKTPPHPIRRILVPLDGSALSELALSHAVQLAEAFHAAIELFRAVPLVNAPFAWRAEAQDKLDTTLYLRGVRDRLEFGGEVTQRQGEYLFHTSPAYALVEDAERFGEDLIVMTTHGHSGIVRWALGSVADATVRMSICPVLLIRPTPEEAKAETER
jgi:nucleotide-binding universal stress UspA family protein